MNESRQVAHLSRWLQEGGLGVADLTSERLDRFLDVRRAGGHGACSVQGLAPLFEVLVGLGPFPEGVDRADLAERGAARVFPGLPVPRARGRPWHGGRLCRLRAPVRGGLCRRR